jgi:hypothetical protein
MTFLDRFKPKNNKKKGGGFALKLPGLPQRSFQGEGQSLGGNSRPGKVIEVTLAQPGPLGIAIEKRPGTPSAIVGRVVPGSQAAAAGLQRGDILCFQGSDGTEEILYDMFRELAASDQRPLCFQVRRVETKQGGAPVAGATQLSAEAYARKQAMIAAAEKREKAAKSRLKPLPKASQKSLPTLRSTADRHRDEAARLAQLEAASSSAESQRAAALAKEQEAQVAAQLGYNPYETSKATAGQARNATVAVTHGGIQGDGGGSTATSASSLPAIPVTAPPPPAAAAADESSSRLPVSEEFLQAFETCVTSNEPAAVQASFTILAKLMVNATTKGQLPDEAVAQKFRKVRLSNVKIKAAIVDVEGALDVMMSVGFQLTEDDESGESMLVYPAGFGGEPWLPKALGMIQQYKAS